MKHKTLFLLLSIFFLGMNTAYSAKPKTEQEWEKCRDKAAASVNFHEVGMAGIQGAILEQCGKRPVNKTKSGSALIKGDCDWLYKQPLQDCGRGGNCGGDEMDLMSMASIHGIQALSNRAFNYPGFINLCRQVCQSSKFPDRKTFEKTICSGS